MAPNQQHVIQNQERELLNTSFKHLFRLLPLPVINLTENV